MEKLIYVSNNVILPDGRQNPFFLQEKSWLQERFGVFYVVCPLGIYRCEADGELILEEKNGKRNTLRALLLGILDPEAWKELFRMIWDRAFTPQNALKLFRFSASTARMTRHLDKCVKKTGTSDTIVYSYWLSYDAAAAAKIKKKHPQIFALARAHAYEIQLERNACNPYLMKRLICKTLDRVAFISENARAGFCCYYKEPLPNACVQYLGSDGESAGCIARGKKEIMTVLTCSSVVPVKRLDRMVEALSQWQECPLRWIHIGDGPESNKIQTMAQEKLTKNPLVTYEFAGYMENRQLHEFLKQDTIDVFANCSKAEGVPVSIMEAMSAGLPVIAPNIFGIPELVRSGCGLLFEQTEDEKNLLAALQAFSAMSAQERENMGKAAYMQWEEYFWLQKNLQALFTPVQ